MKVLDTLKSAEREVRATLAVLRKLTWPEQCEAIRAMTTSTDSLTDTVLFRLLDWRDSGVREEALQALTTRKEAFGRIAARALLADTNSCVRNAAAEILGQIGNRQDIRRLRQALGDESWVMRATVADSLGLIGGKTAHSALLHTLTQDRDPVVRRDAAYALSYANDKAVVPHLEAVLATEKTEQARIGLLSALVVLEQRERLPDLLALLISEDDIVRHATINSLREAVRPEDTEQVLQALRAMREREENPGIKEDAGHAIDAISGASGTD